MKLIILNGPSGIGKSTVSAKLAELLPNSVVIDIDELRRSIPKYKERRQESLLLSYQKAGELIETFLKNEQNVIIDKAISQEDTLNMFTEIGKKYRAQVYEFLLFTDKETLQRRADERGYKSGSLLTREKVGELWEKAEALRKQRAQAIVIDTSDMTVDEVVATVQSAL